MSDSTREPTQDLSDDVPDVPGHRLDAVIGAGGSAVVWSGVDATGRPVAVKVPHRARDGADARQALVEQQVLTAVQHDHLVRLRSVVPLSDGREALVFDLVRGAVLRGMVASRGHLRPGEVVTVLTPICEAVAHVHAAGGVHTDISPSNITLTRIGRPVLLDLGAARVAGREPGAVHGTAGFVAPEVLLGDEPGEAADVYSLGAVAWFCLTGNGAPDTMTRLDLDTVVSHVGPEMAEVIAQAIDPDPQRRPAAAELARLFYDAAPVEAVEVVVGPDQASALTHRLRAEAGRDAPAEPGTAGARWRTRVLVAAVVAVPVLGVTGWALAARQAPTAGAAVTAATARPTPVPSISATPPSASDEVVRDATSPARRPEDLLQALSDRRARALVGLDESALGSVHASGSPSAASDAALVARLRESRVRWEGLRLEVAEAIHVSGDTGRAVLRARVDWTAYVVVSRDGRRSDRPADTGRRLDFALTRGSQGWRLTSITTAPAS
ncbi:serine/threonine-protein kinase [Terrabacter terrigena]|uniref:non-specific serine/threonine protein kinase n=1 Tax=Terrabacter terrigena TaxID=574718 RepID=A0ABW3MU89_9MICO